ncbi:4-hydroxy-tetrahydrodipicolinate synthase [Paenibacillus methanolicus]|uniref:4-hydroxy-tetrahydrodipicolinate synthase n=1 Tax=Paenibacillus methanolicus TaxID=582686 RepID=A0A5S5CGW9_9BACL|nr:4-hydroxy-tetrahydrodipicolinate synthase [Paenibacillus methanolicus]TYP79029.1 4-hydroxy-tetrahydrodipicolinate synthase [Paenibacillus methanolicus]
MLNEADLQGLFVPLITPFDTEERLDLESYDRYLSSLLQHDIQGIVLNGTTGESPTVAWEEVGTLFKAARTCLNQRRLPIIVGSGTNSTAESVRRTEAAGHWGADAVLAVTPYYSRPSEEGIVEHFRRIASVGIPVVAYEVPSRTGVALSPEMMKRILDLDGVIGLKDASGGLSLAAELLPHCPKPILCGEDALLLDMLQLGAAGGMLASANVNTADFLNLLTQVTEGNISLAAETFDRLLPPIRLLFRESNPAPLKWLLARQGLLASDTLRCPMGPISAGLQEELVAIT